MARDFLTAEKNTAGIKALQEIAAELDCSLAQLAIAWCAQNPNVSTVILGASRVEQVHENLGALDVLAQLDDDLVGRIEAAATVG